MQTAYGLTDLGKKSIFRKQPELDDELISNLY